MSTPPESTCSPDTLGESLGPPVPGPALDPLPPGLTARYRLEGELGRGGMGSVLRGHDPVMHRDLALKVLLAEHCAYPELVYRFFREAQLSGQLQHPGVAPVHDMGRLPDQRPYFAMKLVEGRTLAALLAERDAPARDLPRFLKVFEQICQTLAYAHARRIIHRDLKPANVMVGAFGEVLVMDWGLAKPLSGAAEPATLPTISLPNGPTEGSRERGDATAPEAGASQPGAVLGTPAYMPPEQALGQIDRLDERSDVFGLGAVLCEILTGLPPYYGGSGMDVLLKAAGAELADAFARLDACGADTELVRLARACLAPEQEDRPRDGRAVAEAVTAYLAGVQERLRAAELERAAAQARAEAAQAKARAERRARKMTVALAATLLLAVTAAGAGALWYEQDRAARAAQDARLAAEHARKAAATERDVTAALDEATAVGKQVAGLHDDPARWEAALVEALSAVKRAEGVLDNGEGDTSELRGRVDALTAELKAAEKDRRMIARLEEARFQEATAGNENGFDKAGAAVQYKTAFREDGLDLASLDAEQAAERINGRAIRDELLAALAEWHNITRNPDDARNTLKVLHAADPDPASFRNRWNAALEKRDWDTLQVLAVNPEMRDQPATGLVIMAQGWCDVGDPTGAATLLKDANERHPGDFWINLELAYAHTQTKPAAVDGAIRYFTAAVALRPSSSVAHSNLGFALHAKGQLDEALAECRKAVALAPDNADAHGNLALVLRDKGQLDEAIMECRKVVALKPDDVKAHINLGAALGSRGRQDEMVAEFRNIVALTPDDADAHINFGAALGARGRLDEAVAEFRKAVALKPNDAKAYNMLGVALGLKGQLDEAIAEYGKALKIQPDYADAHNNLGLALEDKGQWAQAITEFRKALQFQPNSAMARNNLGNVLDLAERDALLPVILRGEAAPSDAAQQVRFADFCQRYKRLYATASRFYADAFTAEPRLATDLSSGARYNAACAAALAGCGRGEDAAKTDAKERSRWRNQALAWLRDDLAFWTKAANSANPQGRAAAAKTLSHWQEDSDLACVRDAGALAQLPAEERDAWRQLWSDVDDLLKQAGGPEKP